MVRALAFCTALLAAAPAFAQRAWGSGDDRYHRHEGMFMRIEAGGGYMKSSATLGTSDAALSGPAASFGFSLGANVVENLSIFGHVGLSLVANPSFSSGGSSSPSSDSSLNFASVGPGLNYYFMPYNFYVTGMVVMTRLTTTVNGSSGATEAGIGAKIAVGKEWWVGDQWGIGIAGQFTFGSNRDQGTNPPTWSTMTPALAFSASFN